MPLAESQIEEANLLKLLSRNIACPSSDTDDTNHDTDSSLTDTSKNENLSLKCFLELESVVKKQKMLEKLNKFLVIYEAWLTRRKITIEELKNLASSIVNVTEKASIVKLIFSTASTFGSAFFLAAEYLQIKSEWKMKILTASALIGSMSFLCDVIVQYYNKSKVEKMIYLFLLDQDNFEALNSDKQNKIVYDFIEENFPFGINDSILKDILDSQVEMSKKIQLQIKELERRKEKEIWKEKIESNYRLRNITDVDPKLQSRSINYSKPGPIISLQEMLKHLLKTIEVDKKFPKSDIFNNGVKNNEAKIFSVIYLSNVSQKHELVYDSEFLKKTRIFSKSVFANLWWQALENKKSTWQAEKKKLNAELNSVHRYNNKVFWPVLSITMLPLSNNYTANALAIFVTSSIIAFDAFCELTIKIEPKEARILKRLHRILSSEYEDLNINRYYDKNQSD